MAEKKPTPHTMNQLSPGRPIAGFNRTSTGFWIGVSLLLHVVLIGATSVDYIRDTYIDPEGAIARHKAEAERLEKANAPATQPATQPTTAPVAAGTDKPGTPGTTAAPGKVTLSSGSNEENQMQAHKDSQVVKDVTATAKPGEIPTKPDDLDLSVDETNKTK